MLQSFFSKRTVNQNPTPKNQTRKRGGVRLPRSNLQNYNEHLSHDFYVTQCSTQFQSIYKQVFTDVWQFLSSYFNNFFQMCDNVWQFVEQKNLEISTLISIFGIMSHNVLHFLPPRNKFMYIYTWRKIHEKKKIYI